MKGILIFCLIWISMELRLIYGNVKSLKIKRTKKVSDNIGLTTELWVNLFESVRIESFNRILSIQEKKDQNYVEINDGVTALKCFNCNNERYEITHYLIQEYQENDENGIHVYKNGCLLCTVSLKLELVD
jgi:hypothetical protein